MTFFFVRSGPRSSPHGSSPFPTFREPQRAVHGRSTTSFQGEDSGQSRHTPASTASPYQRRSPQLAAQLTPGRVRYASSPLRHVTGPDDRTEPPSPVRQRFMSLDSFQMTPELLAEIDLAHSMSQGMSGVAYAGGALSGPVSRSTPLGPSSPPNESITVERVRSEKSLNTGQSGDTHMGVQNRNISPCDQSRETLGLHHRGSVIREPPQKVPTQELSPTPAVQRTNSPKDFPSLGDPCHPASYNPVDRELRSALATAPSPNLPVPRQDVLCLEPLRSTPHSVARIPDKSFPIQEGSPTASSGPVAAHDHGSPHSLMGSDSLPESSISSKLNPSSHTTAPSPSPIATGTSREKGKKPVLPPCDHVPRVDSPLGRGSRERRRREHSQELRRQSRRQSKTRPPPRVESTQPRDTSSDLSSGEETSFGVRQSVPQPAARRDESADDDDDTETDDSGWIDEDLEVEYGIDYSLHLGDAKKRRRKSKLRWEALLRDVRAPAVFASVGTDPVIGHDQFHALDRETDTTFVLLAAPSHTGKLHSVASRTVRRDSSLKPTEMQHIRSAFAEIAARQHAARTPSLLEQFSRGCLSSYDGPSSSSSGAREEDLRRALETAVGSLYAIGDIYGRRETRWAEERLRLDEDNDRVQLLLKQVLGPGVFGNLINTAR